MHSYEEMSSGVFPTEEEHSDRLRNVKMRKYCRHFAKHVQMCRYMQKHEVVVVHQTHTNKMSFREVLPGPCKELWYFIIACQTIYIGYNALPE